VEITAKLLDLLLRHEYEMTDHALESMDEDDFTPHDLIACLAVGKLRRSWKRARKYEIEGRSIDGRLMRIVATLKNPRFSRSVTAYEIK